MMTIFLLLWRVMTLLRFDLFQTKTNLYFKFKQKLEQTVASNARLEQELLVIRQKLQASRDTRGSQSALGATDSISYGGGATAVLESELRRVQNLVGDMQRQRQELSLAVRQLTENSNNLYQQMNKNGEYSK
jgi:hypothetical protein